jgi:hypothetical protein
MRCDDPISEAPRGMATRRLDEGAIADYSAGKMPFMASSGRMGQRCNQEPRQRVAEHASRAAGRRTLGRRVNGPDFNRLRTPRRVLITFNLRKEPFR